MMFKHITTIENGLVDGLAKYLNLLLAKRGIMGISKVDKSNRTYNYDNRYFKHRLVYPNHNRSIEVRTDTVEYKEMMDNIGIDNHVVLEDASVAESVDIMNAMLTKRGITGSYSIDLGDSYLLVIDKNYFGYYSMYNGGWFVYVRDDIKEYDEMIRSNEYMKLITRRRINVYSGK